jgi:hypothetical protein
VRATLYKPKAFEVVDERNHSVRVNIQSLADRTLGLAFVYGQRP